MSSCAVRAARGADIAVQFDDVERPHEHAGIMAPVADALEQRDAIVAVRCSSELLDGPPTSRDHQRVDPTVRELVLLTLLSAFLCVVALIYADPIPTAVFAALTSGCVVIAAGLSRGSWT